MTKISTFVFAAFAAFTVSQTAQAQVKIGYTNIERMTVAQADEDTRESDDETATTSDNKEFNIGMPPTSKFGVEREMKESGEKGGSSTAGDTNGDGTAEIITAPGAGGGPH